MLSPARDASISNGCSYPPGCKSWLSVVGSPIWSSMRRCRIGGRGEVGARGGPFCLGLCIGELGADPSGVSSLRNARVSSAPLEGSNESRGSVSTGNRGSTLTTSCTPSFSSVRKALMCSDHCSSRDQSLLRTTAARVHGCPSGGIVRVVHSMATYTPQLLSEEQQPRGALTTARTVVCTPSATTARARTEPTATITVSNCNHYSEQLQSLQ